MHLQYKIQKDIYLIVFTLLPSIDCITIFNLYYIYCLLTRNLVLDNHLVELGTQGDLFCFVGCLKRRKEQSFANSPRVRYKPSSHPCGEKKLATALCTWSPNVATELLLSRTFFGAVARELLGHITSTSTTSKKKLGIILRTFSSAIFKLGEDLVL